MSGILSEAAAVEVRGSLIDEACRRLAPNVRPDADLVGEDAVAAVREVLDAIAADTRAERDSLAGRGGVVFGHACDKLSILGTPDSSERARLVSPVIAQLRQERAARERDRRTAEGNAYFRQMRCEQQADRLDELADELKAAAAERRQCREVGMRLGQIEAGISLVRKQP
jgi:hypothetical protein